MRGTLRPFLWAVVLGGLSLAGCKQDENERCEVDSDCAAGLVCSFQVGPSKGVCSVSRTSVNPMASDGGTDGGLSSEAGTTADVGGDVITSDLSLAGDVSADQAASPDVAHDTAGSADTQPDVTAPAADGPSGG